MKYIMYFMLYVNNIRIHLSGKEIYNFKAKTIFIGNKISVT